MKKLPKILIIILVASFFLRVLHVAYGFPMITVADETRAGVFATLNMINEMSISIPAGSSIYYPGLSAYIYLPFVVIELLVLLIKSGSIEAMKELIVTSYGWQLIIAERLASIITGLITLFFVFKIAKKVISEKWAILATVLLSMNLIFFIETTFGRPWSICTMFSMMAVWMLINKRSKMMGLFGGLAYSANPGGAFLFGVLFLIDFFRGKKNAVYGLFVFFVPVVVISLLNWQGVEYNLSLLNSTVDDGGYFGLTLLERFSFYPGMLLRCFPFELFIIGVYLLKGGFKNKNTRLFLLICFGYYLVVGPVLGTSVARYLMPILPLFVILTVFGFKDLIKNFKYKKIAVSLLIIITCFNTFFWNIAMVKSSTHEVVRDWIADNVQQDEWIIAEIDGGQGFALTPSKATLELKKGTEAFLRVDELIYEMYEDSYDPDGKFNYIYLNEVDLGENLDFDGYLIVQDEPLEGFDPIFSVLATRLTGYQPNVNNQIYDNKIYTDIPFFYLPVLLRSGPNFYVYSLNDVGD